MIYLSFCIVLISLPSGQCARILAVYPFPAYSHHKLGDVIFKELARRGHDVTVISPYKEKNPPENFKQILVDDLIEKSKSKYQNRFRICSYFYSSEMKSNYFNVINYNIFQKAIWLDAIGTDFTELALSHPNVKKFLQEDHSFDLVIYNQFTSDAYAGFCYHFKAPCVFVSSTLIQTWIDTKIGNPGHPSYVPQMFVEYGAEMNFLQRFYNSFVYVILEGLRYLRTRSVHNRLLQTHFPDAPHLDELYYNISLILVNSHVSVNDITPSLPNLIHIAGAHVEEPRKLPTDLQTYLDGAKEGVIFFSMGSSLKSKDLPEDKLNAILNVFSKLKQKVLWKWEDEILTNKPINVETGTWLPQQDILAHPNVVLFITHGGMMSTIEAVHNGVPVLGIPIFADQGLNILRAEISGYGKYVYYNDLNEENFGSAINEVLTNPKYKENVKMRSSVIKDQVVKPLDNAIFWIEYVIRYRGAPHLKSAALKLTWYQYHLLDVISCVSSVSVSVSFVLILTISIKKILSPFWRVSSYTKEKQH